MDLRVKRTKRSIVNAFIELRAKKPLEKITVKELSELAWINKATFYSHYNDIYDLSEQLEKEAVEMVLKDIPHPEFLITNPKQGSAELAFALLSQSSLFDTLFSGERAAILSTRIEQGLKNKIYTLYPEYKNNLEMDVLLTILIQGGFHAFASHRNSTDVKELVDVIGRINEHILSGCS